MYTLTVILLIPIMWLLGRLIGLMFVSWHIENGYKEYSIKTNDIEIVNKFRWSNEIFVMLRLKQKPWCKGYRIDHYRKDKIFFWFKPVLLYSTHEVIPNTDFIDKDYKNLPESVINYMIDGRVSSLERIIL